ncbi:hypothetical protein ACOSQ3_013335 [Xanthoceras sorbifolium]
MVRTTNLGSVALLKTLSPNPNTPSKFQRFFLSLSTQKQRFVFGCRPFIGLDLKGKFPGVLLASSSIDANFGVFLVEVAICETECKDSWAWFLRHLYEHIGDDNRKMTFITDRQKGVIDVIKTWWPGSSNRFYVRHIFANLRARNREKNSADLVFKAVKCTNKADFDDVMKKMKEGDMDMYNYMSRIPVCH